MSRDPMANTDTRRHTLPADVAARLRAARLQRGLSLRKAGKRLGISHGYLFELEHGRRCPSVVVARALIDGLRLGAPLAGELLAVARPDAGRCWRGQR